MNTFCEMKVDMKWQKFYTVNEKQYTVYNVSGTLLNNISLDSNILPFHIPYSSPVIRHPQAVIVTPKTIFVKQFNPQNNPVSSKHYWHLISEIADNRCS